MQNKEVYIPKADDLVPSTEFINNAYKELTQSWNYYLDRKLLEFMQDNPGKAFKTQGFRPEFKTDKDDKGNVIVTIVSEPKIFTVPNPDRDIVDLCNKVRYYFMEYFNVKLEEIK